MSEGEGTIYSDKLNYEVMLHQSIQACQLAYRRRESMQEEIGALEMVLNAKIKDRLVPRLEPILEKYRRDIDAINTQDYTELGIENKHKAEQYKNILLLDAIREKNGNEINQIIEVLDELNMLLRQRRSPMSGEFSFVVDEEEKEP